MRCKVSETLFLLNTCIFCWERFTICFPLATMLTVFYCLTILAVNLLNKLWHFLFHKINIQSASQQMTSKTTLSCLRAQRILQSLAHLEVASHPLEILIWTQHKCTILVKQPLTKGHRRTFSLNKTMYILKKINNKTWKQTSWFWVYTPIISTKASPFANTIKI